MIEYDDIARTLSIKCLLTCKKYFLFSKILQSLFNRTEANKSRVY